MKRYCKPNCSPHKPVKNTCVAQGKVGAEIVLEGEGLRGMLAEIFLLGGHVDLELGVDIESECGEEDYVCLVAEGCATGYADSKDNDKPCCW